MKIEKIFKGKVCVGIFDGIKRYKNALVVATISLEPIGQQLPHFAITGGVYFNFRRDLSPSIGGCIHDILTVKFPKSVKPFVKWHLCDKNGPMMHYIENSMYWLGFRGWCDGKKDSPPNFENFKHSAVWPELTQEGFEELRAKGATQAAEILQARLPKLREDFAADMKKIFGDTINLETGKLE